MADENYASSLRTKRTHFVRGEAIGIIAAALIITAAIAVPPLTRWDVKALSLPPLFANLQPRLGPGSAISLAIALIVAFCWSGIVRRSGWRSLLSLTTLVSAVWMLGLDAIDGFDHLGEVLNSAEEYLPSARALADEGLYSAVPDLLSEYVARIPLTAPDNLPVHLASHPPGAVLFFAVLVSCGVTSTWGIGFVLTLLAASIPAAVMSTLRSLGAETAARSISPFLACAPAAIWLAVSADGLFAAAGVWAVAVLAQATFRFGNPQTPRNATLRAILGSFASGVLLGLGTYLSYGFPLLGLVVLAVLVSARDLRPLPWLILGGLVVVVIFTIGGFAWWEAYPELRARYFDGLAAIRPPTYWMWANLAALLCATGPVLGAGLVAVGAEFTDLRRRSPVMLLSAAAVGMVVVADLSNMSRAEVERIWLFMVPWLLVSLAAVPERTRSWLLSVQLVFALLLAHLVQSAW